MQNQWLKIPLPKQDVQDVQDAQSNKWNSKTSNPLKGGACNLRPRQQPLKLCKHPLAWLEKLSICKKKTLLWCRLFCKSARTSWICLNGLICWKCLLQSKWKLVAVVFPKFETTNWKLCEQRSKFCNRNNGKSLDISLQQPQDSGAFKNQICFALCYPIRPKLVEKSLTFPK